MIPLATTTISILRIIPGHDDSVDPLDPQPEPTIISQGVRAHISTSSGEENVERSYQEVVTYRLDCDVTDITFRDQVMDERTNEVYEVVWTRKRLEFESIGMGYIQGGLKRVEGLVS